MSSSWLARKSNNFDQEADFVVMPMDSDASPLSEDLKELKKKRENTSLSLDEALKSVLVELEVDCIQKLCLLHYYLLSKLIYGERPTKLTMIDFEMAQVLALTQQNNKQDFTGNVNVFKTRSLDIGPLKDNLIALREGFLSKLVQKDPIQSEDETAILNLDFQARLQTLAIRNWATPIRMRDITRRLFSTFDKLLISRYGLDSTQVLNVFEAIEQEIDKAYRLHQQKISAIVNAKSKKTAISHYQKHFSDYRWDEIQQACKKRNTLDQVVTLLYMESDAFVQAIYRIDFPSLSRKLNIDVSRLKVLVEVHSIEQGELTEETEEYLLLSNPVWKRPFIKEREDFYIPGVHLLSAFAFDMMEHLVLSVDDSCKTELEARRAAFLERSIVLASKVTFPPQTVHEGVTRNTPGETDTLVVLDRIAIIIEAKSAKVPASAKRGGKSLLQVIKRNIGKAYSQTSELESLLRIGSQTQLRDSNGPLEDICIEADTIFIKLIVMLDPFFSFIADKIIRSNPQFRSALVMGLSDFELILERLRSPAEIANYFLKRLKVQRTYEMYAADELDFLGSYLVSGLEFPGISPSEVLLLTSCSNFIIDPRCKNAGGYNTELQMLEWWLACIKQVEKTPSTIPFELKVVMWSLTFTEQRTIEELRIELVNELMNYKNDEIARRALEINGSSFPLTIYLIGIREDFDASECKINETMIESQEIHENRRSIALVFNLSSRSYPFDKILWT